jgi:hypothetical protein
MAHSARNCTVIILSSPSAMESSLPIVAVALEHTSQMWESNSERGSYEHTLTSGREAKSLHGLVGIFARKGWRQPQRQPESM